MPIDEVRTGAAPLTITNHKSQITNGSVQRGNPAPQRLDVLPDLVVLLARFLVHLAHARELQIRLQIAKRAGDIVEMVGQQTAIAQLAQRRWRERDEQLGDGSRLRKRA